MTDKELLHNIKVRQEAKRQFFLEFTQAENFVEAVDMVGNFIKDVPVFYKKITENKFLVFTIPLYDKAEDAPFLTDFYEVTAASEEDFLHHKLTEEHLKSVLSGFDLEDDLAVYNEQVAKTTLE